MRLFPYPYNPYPFYHSGDRKFLAADAVAPNKKLEASAIAKIISDNQAELKYELVKLGLACSCTINQMKENDLINTVVESAGNEELKKWFAGKDNNAILGSALNKSEIIKASLDYKSQAKSGSRFQVSDAIAITGISLLLFSAWAISFYGTKRN